MVLHPLVQQKATLAAQRGARSLGHSLVPFVDNQDRPQRLCSCCSRCGMQVVIDSSEYCVYGEAVERRCDPNAERALESQAWLIGQSPALLLAQLEAGVARLEPDIRAHFSPGQFDPDNFRLLSMDGVYMMWWDLRDYSNAPISPENPQTAMGITLLEQGVLDTEMTPAYYIGERLNPNGTSDALLWMLEPLEPGEAGVIYYDVQARRRFRRHEGVVGYYIDSEDAHQHTEATPLTPNKITELIRARRQQREDEARQREQESL